MPLYEHLDEHGEVDEQVLAVPGSINDDALAARAADEGSRWRAAGELTPPAEDDLEQLEAATDTPPALEADDLEEN